MSNFKSRPSFLELGLTKTEAHQIEKRAEEPKEEIERVKFFQQNPEIRKALITDPFDSTTQERIRGISMAENVYGTLRAAILAEPNGIYEEAFHKLPRSEQLQRLYDQIDSSAEMTIRIQKYIENNLIELDKISDEDLYKTLCQIAFKTSDENEIQSKYALSQRRGFRLSIANFLEERSRLSVYKIESSADQKAFAEKYLKQQFTGNITIEQLPIGFVIYLDEQDYALIDFDDKSPKSIRYKGATLSSDWLPTELKGKIILINRGGKESGAETIEELAGTRNHEIRHVLFREFHAQQNEVYMFDTREALSKCETEQDYRNIAGMLFEDFVEGAKDEIIAYFSQGRFNESYSALRFYQYQWYIKEVEDALGKRSDMPEETKKAILETFTNNRRKCFKTIRRIRFVAESMYKQPDNRFVQRMLAKLGLKKYNTTHQNDIVEALLRNTPGTKIHRLAKYTGLTVDEIRSDRIIKEKDQQAIDNLNNLLTIPEHYDENWWAKASQTRDQIRQQLPVGALPTLISAVSTWSERKWGSFWVEEAILLTKDYIRVHGVTDTDRQKIIQVINGIITQKTEIKKFEKSVKFAKELLKELNT